MFIGKNGTPTPPVLETGSKFFIETKESLSDEISSWFQWILSNSKRVGQVADGFYVTKDTEIPQHVIDSPDIQVRYAGQHYTPTEAGKSAGVSTMPVLILIAASIAAGAYLLMNQKK